MNFFDAVRAQLLSKVVAGLLVLSALILAGGFVVGLIGGDMRGQVAFGLLAACTVVSISVVISLRTPKPVFRVARAAWLSIALLVFAIALMLGGEAGDTVLTYAMVVLGFPSSLLAAPLVGSILGGATKQATGLTALWFALSAVGYIQWFVLLARPLRRQDVV
jgi:hypothetical protein